MAIDGIGNGNQGQNPRLGQFPAGGKQQQQRIRPLFDNGTETKPVDNGNGTFTSEIKQKDGKVLRTITYWDRNGDGKVDDSEIYTITNYKYSDDGKQVVGADVYIDNKDTSDPNVIGKNAPDGYYDEVHHYEVQDGKMVLTDATKERDIRDIDENTDFMHEKANRDMKLRKDGLGVSFNIKGMMVPDAEEEKEQ